MTRVIMIHLATHSRESSSSSKESFSHARDLERERDGLCMNETFIGPIHAKS